MSQRVAHAGDDVLALGVDEEVAAGLRRAGDLVAAERDARPAAVALVAEHHLLDVDRGAPVVGDAVDAPVGRPRARRSRSRTRRGSPARAARAGRWGTRRALEAARELLQRLDVELGVVLDAAVGLDALDLVLEALALDAAHDVAEHLHEAPVGVPGEALVVGLRRPAPATDSSLSPRFRTVSSIPGIDSRAPERTETSSGSSASPSFLPACSSSAASASSTCSSSPSGKPSSRM